MGIIDRKISKMVVLCMILLVLLRSNAFILDDPNHEKLRAYLDSKSLVKTKLVHKSRNELDASLFEKNLFSETSASLKNDLRNRYAQFWSKMVQEELAKDAKSKSTLLHYAAAFEEVDIIEILLENGAKVNALDELSRTPLMLACESLKLRSVEVLL